MENEIMNNEVVTDVIEQTEQVSNTCETTGNLAGNIIVGTLATVGGITLIKLAITGVRKLIDKVKSMRADKAQAKQNDDDFVVPEVSNDDFDE